MVAARAAILQSLRRGPAYGSLLMRRVQEASAGRCTLAPGSVYPALRSLARAGLVRRWTIVAGRVRGGRARTYYELTVAGVQEAEAEGRALATLIGLGRAAAIPPGERAAMRQRIERAASIFDFAVEAREALARSKRRA